MTRVVSTHAASAPQACGHKSDKPFSAACSAAGSAPVTAFNLPSKDKAPMAKVSCRQSPRIASIALSIASAIARSKCAPSLGKSAGVRLMVIRFGGNAKDKLCNADLTRSRASLTALSANPMMVKPRSPAATAHSTSTERTSRPQNATVTTRAIIAYRSLISGHGV